jgi:hypothetical protein
MRMPVHHHGHHHSYPWHHCPNDGDNAPEDGTGYYCVHRRGRELCLVHTMMTTHPQADEILWDIEVLTSMLVLGPVISTVVKAPM